MIQIENIPAWLRENGRFVLWGYRYKDGRKTKVPLNRYGRQTDPTDVRNGITAAEALNAWKKTPDRFDGIGVMITPPLVGIDLDHVISKDGELSQLAEAVLGMVDTYAEVSPSAGGTALI